MNICKEFLVKDIIKYELENDVNILEELSFCNFSIVADVISMGCKISEEEALDKLGELLKNYEITEIVKMLAYEIIGNEPSKENDNVDQSEFSSFSDVLENFYSEIQTVDKNLGLSEFQNISTRYMYKYAEGLKKRYVFNKNQEYQSQYSNVAMFMSALAGKLKECPQLNEDGTLHTKSLREKLLANRG